MRPRASGGSMSDETTKTDKTKLELTPAEATETAAPPPDLALETARPPKKPRACRTCGVLIEGTGPCPECGAAQVPGVATRLISLATHSLDKRNPILIALLAIAAASVALGFELGRHALQAILDDNGNLVTGPDGIPVLHEVGAREEMVSMLISAIVMGLYSIGERVWGHLQAQAKRTRQGLVALLVGGAMGGGGLIGTEGCASHELNASGPVDIVHQDGPPCRHEVWMGGHRVSLIEGAADGDLCEIQYRDGEGHFITMRQVLWLHRLNAARAELGRAPLPLSILHTRAPSDEAWRELLGGAL